MAGRRIFSGVNWGAVLDSVRTAFAAVAAMLLARLLKLPEYYWAPISTIVIVQSTIPPRTLGWQRFVGTALGAVLGAALATFFHPSALVYASGDSFVRGAGVVIARGGRLPVCRNYIEYYFADSAGASSVDHRLAPVPGSVAGNCGGAGGDDSVAAGEESKAVSVRMSMVP